jgi:hypothetical protein
MFVNITPRWAICIFGCIALLLGTIPFIAFYYGPRIRARSKYSKELMTEEKARIGAERGEKVRGDGQLSEKQRRRQGDV